MLNKIAMVVGYWTIIAMFALIIILAIVNSNDKKRDNED